MDKRVTVIESIQKLLNLGVSDKEIIENLADVGIEERDALALMQTRDELYRYLDYHAYEQKLDALFAASRGDDR